MVRLASGKNRSGGPRETTLDSTRGASTAETRPPSNRTRGPQATVGDTSRPRPRPGLLIPRARAPRKGFDLA